LNIPHRGGDNQPKLLKYQCEVKALMKTLTEGTFNVTALVDTRADLNKIKEKYGTTNIQIIREKI
jgi:hypothetical protein